MLITTVNFIDIFQLMYTVMQFVTSKSAVMQTALSVPYNHNCIYNKTINLRSGHFTNTQEMLVN